LGIVQASHIASVSKLQHHAQNNLRLPPNRNQQPSTGPGIKGSIPPIILTQPIV